MTVPKAQWDLRVVNWVKNPAVNSESTSQGNKGELIYSYVPGNFDYKNISMSALADQAVGTGYWYKNSIGNKVFLNGVEKTLEYRAPISNRLSVVGNLTDQTIKLSDVLLSVDDQSMTLEDGADQGYLQAIFKYNANTNSYESFYASKFSDFAKKNGNSTIGTTLLSRVSLDSGQAVWLILSSKAQQYIENKKITYSIKSI